MGRLFTTTVCSILGAIFLLCPFEAISQNAAARKQWTREEQERFHQGGQIQVNFATDGSDETIFVWHETGFVANDDSCQWRFAAIAPGLRVRYFTRFICTDGNARLSFDITPIVESERPRPQPFGFHARMIQQEAVAAVGQSAVRAGFPKPAPYGSLLALSTAPKPISSFQTYFLKFSAEGLFEVSAFTPGIHSASNGTQVRDGFNDLRQLIAGKYGEPQCLNYRDAGTSDRPDFFMLYLKDNEQHLSCTWDLVHTMISLEARSLDIDTATVFVVYQFIPELQRSNSSADQKKKDSF